MNLLSLQDVRNGTGFPPGTRFVAIPAETLPPPASDPLSVAYMAIGAVNVLNEYARTTSDDGHVDFDQWGGQLGFIGEVIQHEPVMEAIYQERPDDYGGVFVYEVAEPFGAFIAERLLSGESTDVATLQAHVRALIEPDLLQDNVPAASTPPTAPCG
jgi:hypothetical protein